METLKGTAGAPYFDLTMSIGKRVHEARSDDGLTLILDDGNAVALELGDTEHSPNVDEKDDFGSLLARGVAEPFLDRAPGDHVEVSIWGVRFDEGETISARGVVARRSAPGSGYRDAGELRPLSITVSFLAAGDDAAEQLATTERDARKRAERARRKSKKTSKPAPNPKTGPQLVPLVFPAFIAATAGIASVTALGLGVAGGGLTDTAASSALYGLYLSAAAIFLTRRRRFLPDIRTKSEELAGKGMRTSFGKAWAVTLMLSTLFVGILASLSIAASGGFVTVIALGLAVSLLLGERRAARRLRIIISTPPNTDAGRWGALDGVVESGSYARTRTHTLNRSSYEDSEGRTRTQTWWTYRDSVSPQPMTVTLDTGDLLHVDTGGAAQAAAQTEQRKRMRKKKKKWWIQDNPPLLETIRVGDHVRVVGRPTRDEQGWHVKSTGPDSLLLLGSRGGPARGAARSALQWRRLGIAGLVAIAGVGVAFTQI